MRARRGGRAHGGRGQYPHGIHVRHRTRVPAIEVLVEGFGLPEPGERASDARSERERERVGAGERTAGEVSTHRLDMSVTPVVHDVDNFELSPFTKPAKAPLSLFVYFTPSTTPVSPTAALGHLMVSPSL